MIAPSRFALRSPVIPLAVGFALLAAVVIATGWFIEQSKIDSRAIRNIVSIEDGLARTLTLVLDAETGQRGYLLTGDESYLAPFNAALKDLPGQLANLKAKLAGDSGQQMSYALLEPLVRDELVELQHTVGLRQAGKADDAMAIVLGGSGKAGMDRIRSLVGAMKSREALLMEARQARAERTASRLEAGGLAAIVLVLLISSAALIEARLRFRDLKFARDTLHSSNQRLQVEMLERQKAETALRQAQKMEAIGRLTGGVAHDFNNMLAIVIGNLQLAQRRLRKGVVDVDTFLTHAAEGASRAAMLTSRLLAFARRQPLSPQPIEVNKLVGGISELMRRTLGEEIAIETVLAGGLWRIHADANQLESALLNLALNARDAMPSGGRLTIETANADLDERYAASHNEVTAGQYVMIAVTDTGEGMTEEVKAQAFEPFFTTKASGHGTGLGLSQVYGFVKQSGGHAKIYSEVGRGTSIKIYLPRFSGADEATSLVQPLLQETGAPRGTVLVVEDEEAVRRISLEILRELGFRTLEASGGRAALELLDANPDISLVFTDVVMPEMNGRKLADEIKRRFPEMKILFTSGYTRNAIVHNGTLDPGTAFIAKPFSHEQIVAKLNEILHSS
ncbi:Histidine kinase-, DNA gyrase B-, and HSP90-like ATPase [Faunimonas pinastri]|uniref:histidine kinase n=1 Tax=Faunimonas pinastri TaxID=1855383 RepID=A0A1H9AKT9_9HYPH|nr:CHASE3 domain-containing protein [Faunimonas pinastri]SEP77374.1 Histidine kinase-, DNA gyrase B-, and HSP90-like ATPase [Faunimonas pinastri]